MKNNGKNTSVTDSVYGLLGVLSILFALSWLCKLCFDNLHYMSILKLNALVVMVFFASIVLITICVSVIDRCGKE